MSDFTPGGDTPGGLVGVPAAPPGPQPADPPGDVSGGWLKVGAQGTGGNGEFTYGDGYFGGDSGIWKQT